MIRLHGVVGFGLRFYPGNIIFSRQLPSELTVRNLTKTCHIIGSQRDLKMHVPFENARPKCITSLVNPFRHKSLTIDISDWLLRLMGPFSVLSVFVGFSSCCWFLVFQRTVNRQFHHHHHRRRSRPQFGISPKTSDLKTNYFGVFRQLRNLMINLTADIFGLKHDVIGEQLKNYKGSPTLSPNFTQIS